jgi:hypothetical protein
MFFLEIDLLFVVILAFLFLLFVYLFNLAVSYFLFFCCVFFVLIHHAN